MLIKEGSHKREVRILVQLHFWTTWNAQINRKEIATQISFRKQVEADIEGLLNEIKLSEEVGFFQSMPEEKPKFETVESFLTKQVPILLKEFYSIGACEFWRRIIGEFDFEELKKELEKLSGQSREIIQKSLQRNGEMNMEEESVQMPPSNKVSKARLPELVTSVPETPTPQNQKDTSRTPFMLNERTGNEAKTEKVRAEVEDKDRETKDALMARSRKDEFFSLFIKSKADNLAPHRNKLTKTMDTKQIKGLKAQRVNPPKQISNFLKTQGNRRGFGTSVISKIIYKPKEKQISCVATTTGKDSNQNNAPFIMNYNTMSFDDLEESLMEEEEKENEEKLDWKMLEKSKSKKKKQRTCSEPKELPGPDSHLAEPQLGTTVSFRPAFDEEVSHPLAPAPTRHILAFGSPYQEDKKENYRPRLELFSSDVLAFSTPIKEESASASTPKFFGDQRPMSFSFNNMVL